MPSPTCARQPAALPPLVEFLPVLGAPLRRPFLRAGRLDPVLGLLFAAPPRRVRATATCWPSADQPSSTSYAAASAVADAVVPWFRFSVNSRLGRHRRRVAAAGGSRLPEARRGADGGRRPHGRPAWSRCCWCRSCSSSRRGQAGGGGPDVPGVGGLLGRWGRRGGDAGVGARAQASSSPVDAARRSCRPCSPPLPLSLFARPSVSSRSRLPMTCPPWRATDDDDARAHLGGVWLSEESSRSVRVAPLPTDWQFKIRISPNFRDRRRDGPVSAPLALTGRSARTAGGGNFRADGDVGDDDRRAGEARLVATTVVVKKRGRSCPFSDFEQISLRRASAR